MKKIIALSLGSILLLTACGKTETSLSELSEVITNTVESSETGSDIEYFEIGSEETIKIQNTNAEVYVEFIDKLYVEYNLPAEYKRYSCICFFDDDIPYLLFETYNGNGLSYFIINTDEPRVEYVFDAFDRCELFEDRLTEQIVIKYISSYGLFTCATVETNFVFLGEDICEIKNVHFSGTSGSEEFYIEKNGEKVTCTEEELDKSISTIESSLTEYTEYEFIPLTDIGAAQQSDA